MTKLTAVNRADDKRYPGEIDAKTGVFTIKNLPLGATYDMLFEMGDNVTLEGVNLNVPHSDYEVEQPMTKEDVKAITEGGEVAQSVREQRRGDDDPRQHSTRRRAC